MSRLPVTVQASQYGSVNNAGRRRKLQTPIVLQRGPAQGLEHTDDRGLDAVQRRVADATGQAKAFPLADANIIYGLSFVSGTALTVSHGLGRAFVSCVLCGQSAAGSLSVQRPFSRQRSLTQQNILDDRQIVVTPNFTGSGDLLVW